MRKKIVSVFMCIVLGVMTLAIAGCGKDAPAQEAGKAASDASATETSAESSKEASEGMVTDATWAQLQEVYLALIDAYNATVDMYSNEAVAKDESIESALKTAEEVIEEIGKIDPASLSEETAQGYMKIMMSVNDLFAAVIDTAQVNEDAVDYSKIFNECYAGITDDEDTYAYLAFGDAVGALLFYNTESKEAGSFIGEYTVEDSGAVTIADETLGVTMTFIVDEVDGGYFIHMGDEIGDAFVAPITVEEFTDALKAIDAGTRPEE